jgi:fermentation-respiration switch protein FrsA (DUF1100 family)
MTMKWPHFIVAVILVVILFTVFYPRIENYFIFFPDASFERRPEDMPLDYRDVYFHTEDGERLHGWFFPLNKGNPVILFCHGNAGNISHRLDNIGHLLKRGLQVFIFDYRGYGKSSGRPSEKGVYLDGLAAYDHLIGGELLLPEDIILFGRSLGAAVAIEVALERGVRSLIIESAFTSIRDMSRALVLFRPFAAMLPAHYHNLAKIEKVRVPKLIIHGEKDEIVPFWMGQALFEAAKAPKFFIPIPGAGHNDTYLSGGNGYFQTISDFARDSKISLLE